MRMHRLFWTTGLSTTLLISACGAPQNSRDYVMEYNSGGAPIMADEAYVEEERAEPNVSNTEDDGVNPWTKPSEDALSTFAIDVDTASYTIARSKLERGTLPPAASVRVEEFVNYFRYDYPQPDASQPFAVHFDAAPSPVNAEHHLLRIGVQGRTIPRAQRKPANLVFLVDVSGSMGDANKLPLAKKSLHMLVDNLRDDDVVSMVTYAGNTRLVLAATPASQRGAIHDAIDDLTSSGGTAMDSGMVLAYQQAHAGMRKDSVNRVIVLSDGDANIGNTSYDTMLDKIEGYVAENITMTTIGLGMGNYKDTRMEQLANRGNGNYYYIDDEEQAHRVFVEDLEATLEVIAKDVKIQVEFDPNHVEQYRLIGYENRDIADEDFKDDKVDAGEIGAGHSVTALYEVKFSDTLKDAQQLATVRIRYKQPNGDTASQNTFSFDARSMAPSFDAAPDDFRFAVSVVAFAEVLRNTQSADAWNLNDIAAIASAADRDQEDRRELVALVKRAQQLRD